MGWIIMAIVVLVSPLAVIKFMFQNAGLALIILAIIVISGIFEAF